MVWEILKNEYVKEACSAKDKSSIKKYCGLYQEAFPESNSEADYILKSIQDIDGLETQVTKIKGKYEYDLRAGIESAATYDWYVQNRLETKYEDTISGAISKEIDNWQKGNDSELVAYNVDYIWGTAFPGEDAVILHSNETNPFTQSGVHTLNCILLSEKRTLINSSGFQWEAPVYEIIPDTGILINDYNQIVELENQKEILWKEVFDKLEMLLESNSPRETIEDTKTENVENGKGYSIPLESIFPSDWTQIVSWHSESTGYYMIPESTDGDPVIYFSVENNIISGSLAYGVLIDSVKQNEAGGVVCTGKMYLYTKSFGRGEEEDLNGTVEVTWSSLESMDFLSIRMIDGHQMTDTSMITDDYSYYGLIDR